MVQGHQKYIYRVYRAWLGQQRSYVNMMTLCHMYVCIHMAQGHQIYIHEIIMYGKGVDEREVRACNEEGSSDLAIILVQGLTPTA